MAADLPSEAAAKLAERLAQPLPEQKLQPPQSVAGPALRLEVSHWAAAGASRVEALPPVSPPGPRPLPPPEAALRQPPGRKAEPTALQRAAVSC